MRSWTGRLASLTKARYAKSGVASFIREDSGATYVLVASTMTVLMGMAGLGFDATIWYKDKRDIQSVADLSVLAALHTKLEGGSLKEITTTARDHAERNNFVHEQDGMLIVNNPPLYGDHVGDSNYIEVIVNQPRKLNFASMFLGDEVNISARAVSGLIGMGDNCVLALDQSADAALEFTGSTEVTTSCGVASNSVSSSSISVGGSAYVEAKSAQAFGDVDANMLDSPDPDSNGLYTSDPNQALAVRLDDPYADEPIPAVFGCNYNPPGGGYKDTTLDEGVYCGNLNLKENVTLNPGVYIIYGGDLSIQGTNVNGDGVTFILTAANANQIGGIKNFNGNASGSLTAPGPDGHAAGPYQGEYAGMLIMQDSRYSSNQDSKLNGGASMALSGAVYLPNSELDIQGNASNTPGCLQIVARIIKFTGNSDINNSPEACNEQGVAEISQQRARLIE